jgi:Bacterial dnaA protein helix-turn-helix
MYREFKTEGELLEHYRQLQKRLYAPTGRRDDLRQSGGDAVRPWGAKPPVQAQEEAFAPWRPSPPAQVIDLPAIPLIKREPYTPPKEEPLTKLVVVRVMLSVTGLKKADVVGKDASKRQPIAYVRQCMMWLMRRFLPPEYGSFPQIGKFFDRDHTTALHAARRVDECLDHPNFVDPPADTLVDWAQAFWDFYLNNREVVHVFGRSPRVSARDTDGGRDLKRLRSRPPWARRVCEHPKQPDRAVCGGGADGGQLAPGADADPEAQEPAERAER